MTQVAWIKHSGIYRIKNTINGHVYVGSAVQFGKRWWAHRKALRNGTHHSAYLQNAWKKYGEDAFAFEVLELVESKVLLLEREAWWIEHTKCFDRLHGYNVQRIPGSPLGTKASLTTRRKMSDSRKGKKLSAEHSKNCSLARMGKPLSAEHRKKLSAAHKGVNLTEKHRAAIGAGHVGKKWSVAARKKLSSAAKARGQEYYERLRQAQIARPRDEDWRSKMSAAAKQMSPEARERINAGQRAGRERRRAALGQASLF